MAELTLYHGYPGVSSWSLRAWLAARKSGRDFETELVDYRRPEGRARLRALSPNGLVPLLVHRRPGADPVMVWESLAVCEYLAELAPEARLWPEASAARAHARAISAEMHAGFADLRRALDMAVLERRTADVTPAVRDGIKRIETIWTACREAHGHAGSWLFGHFTVADAMFAPVATRFRTYGIRIAPAAAAYQATVLADPDMALWTEMARQMPAPPQHDTGAPT